MLSAGARNEFRFHINGRRACGLRDFLSLLIGIDHRGHRQQIADMDRQT